MGRESELRKIATARIDAETRKKTKVKNMDPATMNSIGDDISSPKYDKMNAERAKERNEMKAANALKDKMHNQKKNLMKSAMGTK